MGAESEEDQLVLGFGGLVTRAEAERVGWTRSRLRWSLDGGRLIRLRPGVYTSARVWAEADTRRQHRLVLMAYQRVDPALVGCGLSAAAALGLPLPQEDFGLPVLLFQRPHLRRRAPGERASKIRNGPVVVPVEQIIIGCARVLPIEWGLAVADAAIFKGWITEERLRTADVPRRSRGALKVRWVLDHARARVESPLESLARAVIILGGFPEPAVQRVIETWAGRFRVDLLDEVAGLITEADGKVKYRRGEADEADPLWREKRREDALRDEGPEVIRFTMADYYRQSQFLKRYDRARERALRKR